MENTFNISEMHGNVADLASPDVKVQLRGLQQLLSSLAAGLATRLDQAESPASSSVVIVEVDGGVVCSAFANRPGITLHVLDHDSDRHGEQEITLEEMDMLREAERSWISCL